MDRRDQILSHSLELAQRKQKCLPSRRGSVSAHTEGGTTGPWLLWVCFTPFFDRSKQACLRSCQDPWLRPRLPLATCPLLLLPSNPFCVALRALSSGRRNRLHCFFSFRSGSFMCLPEQPLDTLKCESITLTREMQGRVLYLFRATREFSSHAESDWRAVFTEVFLIKLTPPHQQPSPKASRA